MGNGTPHPLEALMATEVFSLPGTGAYAIRIRLTPARDEVSGATARSPCAVGVAALRRTARVEALPLLLRGEFLPCSRS